MPVDQTINSFENIFIISAADDDFYDQVWNIRDEDEFEKKPESTTLSDEGVTDVGTTAITPTPTPLLVLPAPKAFVSGGDVRVQWSVPPGADSLIDAFKVEFKRDDTAAQWIDTGDRIEAHVRAYTVHGLFSGIK